MERQKKDYSGKPRTRFLKGQVALPAIEKANITPENSANVVSERIGD